MEVKQQYIGVSKSGQKQEYLRDYGRLNLYEEKIGINWQWQAADGAMTKAPLGGEATGPNPTDRAKSGTKRSVLVDGRGVPLAIAGANVNDHLLLEQTLSALQIAPNIWFQFLFWLGVLQIHLCLDKAYDNGASYQVVSDFGYREHISKKDHQVNKVRKASYKARRWIVEASHSWLNRFRKILIRFEKTEASYLALLHLACAITCFRKAGVLG